MSETRELMIVAAEKAIHNKFLLGGRATRQIAELALSACAAPDLAEALERIISAVDAHEVCVQGPTIKADDGEQWNWVDEWLHRARSALARAKGAS